MKNGSTATTYTPHQEQTQVVNLGKNLYSGGIEVGAINGASGQNSDSTTTLRSDSFTNVSNVRQIAIVGSDNISRVKVLFTYDSQWRYLGNYTVSNNNVFNLDAIILSNRPSYYSSNADIYYIKFVVTSTTDTSISYGVLNNTTTYAPYFTPIELCKIGDYQDYLYKSNDKWYKKGYIYKIANKTNWVVTRNNGSNNRGLIGLEDNDCPVAVNGYSTINCVSNMLIGFSQGTQASTTDINNIAINNALMYVKFADAINTKELVKSQLDSMTSLVIYYVLATATDTEITNETLINQLNNIEKLMSYNGTTNISVSGNLPIILNVKALKGE